MTKQKIIFWAGWAIIAWGSFFLNIYTLFPLALHLIHIDAWDFFTPIFIVMPITYGLMCGILTLIWRDLILKPKKNKGRVIKIRLPF